MSKEDFTRNITVEDILSHRTGFPNHDASYLGVNASQPDTPKSVTQNLRNLPLSAGLRTKFQYCNQMFTVAAYLVEVLSGMPFADFLQKRIFDPLGMQSTFVQPEVAQRSGLGSNLSVGYQWSQERKAYFTIPYQNVPEAVGAGSIVTSTTDYIKWVQAMLSQSSPLSPTLVQDLIAPRIICNGSDTPDEMEPWTSFEMYALGWEVYFYRGVRVVRHGGSISGFSSLHFFLPEHGLGGALFGNSDSAADVAEVVMQEIIDEMLGVPAVERPDWNARKWDAIKKYEQVMAEERQDVIDELCPGFEQSPPLKDVERYVGHYWNEGYHGMKVTIREGELFVDASDRSSNGFVLKFEHVRDDTLFVVELTTPYESGDHEFFKAEFRIEDGMVVKMGLKLEPDMEEMIWFDRQRRS
jgi:CubicO group peptidase (beta-lactamase class C family)